KLWNRMSSGSYFPPPIKGVPIPKKSGGVRLLGVPTVADRVAQTAVKMMLEPTLEPLFHPDSYGYRPGRSALDAVAVVRQRCWKYDWVLEFDIKGLFDNIDHQLLLKALRKHCQEPWVLLYVERWLKAPMQMADGTITER
ncbi:group II intron reverse transcriptase/maturase, partial [Pseudomonas sp. MWU12-2534b]